jgi:hypothetical protein
LSQYLEMGAGASAQALLADAEAVEGPQLEAFRAAKEAFGKLPAGLDDARVYEEIRKVYLERLATAQLEARPVHPLVQEAMR